MMIPHPEVANRQDGRTVRYEWFGRTAGLADI
jgi:hypothetical protein